MVRITQKHLGCVMNAKLHTKQSVLYTYKIKFSVYIQNKVFHAHTKKVFHAKKYTGAEIWNIKTYSFMRFSRKQQQEITLALHKCSVVNPTDFCVDNTIIWQSYTYNDFLQKCYIQFMHPCCTDAYIHPMVNLLNIFLQMLQTMCYMKQC